MLHVDVSCSSIFIVNNIFTALSCTMSSLFNTAETRAGCIVVFVLACVTPVSGNSLAQRVLTRPLWTFSKVTTSVDLFLF